MVFEVTSFVLGLLAGVIITTAVTTPRVGRIVARTMATLALGAGVGGLVWAIDALVRGAELRPVVWERLSIAEPSEALGWSAGLLLAGVAALVLSFIGGSADSEALARRLL